MTYALIVVPFLLVAAILSLATLVRPRFGARMRASAVAALVLVLLTAVFDNIMIAAAFLVPAIACLLTPRTIADDA